jgi:chromosome segregation ATPase
MMSDDPVIVLLVRLEMKVDEIGAKLSNVDARLSNVDAKLSNMDAKLSNVDAKLSNMDTRLANVEAGLAATRADVMARLDRHEDKLSAMHSDITVNMAAVGHVRDNHAGMRKEQESTNELVYAMMKQIRRLQTDVEELKDRK